MYICIYTYINYIYIIYTGICNITKTRWNKRQQHLTSPTVKKTPSSDQFLRSSPIIIVSSPQKISNHDINKGKSTEIHGKSMEIHRNPWDKLWKSWWTTITAWWFQTWLDYFPFHIWDVIRNPLTNSYIFQDGHIAPPTRFCYRSYPIIIHIKPYKTI